MFLRKLIIGILIIGCPAYAIGQTNNNPQASDGKFAVYAGVGPNYYFNNLIIGKSYVNSFNYSIIGRFMWEPEHLLSLGFETGYYRLYTFNAPEPNLAHISNTAIPLQVVISMKFLKTFYASFSMGQSILLNKANSTNVEEFKASAISTADFTGAVGYKYRLSRRFSLSGEARYFYSSSFVDRNFTLAVVGGFKF